MNITDQSIEKIEDPFGILQGERYEILLDIEVPEDDELYSENGLTVKVLWIVDEKSSRMSHYLILEKETGNVLEFELEEDELAVILEYCQKLFTD